MKGRQARLTQGGAAMTYQTLRTEILDLGPMVDEQPYEYCFYCEVLEDAAGDVDHHPGCLWLRLWQEEKGERNGN